MSGRLCSLVYGTAISIALAFSPATWDLRILAFRLVNGESQRKYLPATVPGGLAIFDFDGDGKLDIFLPNGGELPSGRKTSPSHANRLLRNLGGLRFEDVAQRAGVSGDVYNFGAAVADYDNDGHLDLLTTGLTGVTLYRNTGDGTFSDVTSAAGIDNRGRWSVAATWLDIDNDSDVDLFIVNYVQWDPKKEPECRVAGKIDFCHPRFYDPVPNALFRNNGDGTFTDISDVSGVGEHKGKGMSAQAADFDGDGLIDLYVTNDRLFAFFFHNLGKGRFEEVAFDSGVAVPEDGRPVSGMGVDAQDFDNDGRPDLLYSALRDETFPLYRNTGKQFAEVTGPSKLGPLARKMSGWGILFADLDNDGWKDIVAACSDALSPSGGRGQAAMERPVWFRNTADGKFSKSEDWETLTPAMYRGALTADLNEDGCLDVVLTALNSEARVLANPCSNGKNWLEVDVRQPGARIRVGNQWQHTTTSVGYASSYAGPLHFGLDHADAVTVEAIYPDGHRRTMETKVNRIVKLEP